MSRQVWRRGDIVVADFDPTLGHEQQGRRPAIVVTQEALNRLGMIGVCPITQGGQSARHAGISVSLTVRCFAGGQHCGSALILAAQVTAGHWIVWARSGNRLF